jgi:lysophospholipase L1-like esterase
MYSIMKFVIFILIGTAIIFLAAEFLRTFLLLQKGRDLLKTSAPFQSIKHDSKIKILFLGDSTAVSTGAEDSRDSVAGRFGIDYSDAHIVNLGENGNRVKDIAERFNPEEYKNFDLVVIQAGGNDILRFTPLSQLEKDLNALLGKAKQSGDQAVVLHSGNIGLAPFFPRPFGWIWSYRTRQVRNLYMKAAETHGAIYVDLYTEREGDPFLPDVKKFYAPDFLHASGEGYRIWYEKIREAMSRSRIQL